MDKEEYFLDMASDIEYLVELLNKKGINISAAYKVSTSIKSKKELEYTLPPLSIEIGDTEKFPKRISHSKSVKSLVLLFDLSILGSYDQLKEDKDPFKEFSFNIVIKGKNKNNPQSKLVYALHLDRHNIEEQQDGNEPNQAHPLYHFQFGGSKIKEESIDFGQALFLDAPRIMHHPIEFILGIDFILSNFVPQVWNMLKEDRSYKKILSKYQKDFILPYFRSITSHLESNPSIWNAQNLYPQLVRQ